jgi:hypothetical protein
MNKTNIWINTPNYLWGNFSPAALVLTGDQRPIEWLKLQIELNK